MRPVALRDLAGLRCAAAAGSSGAGFLAASGLPFRSCPTLDAAPAALDARRVDAVVNSVGALRWAVTEQHRATVVVRDGLLVPALMGFAVPPNSPLVVPPDQALVRVTTSTDWSGKEAAYCDR